MMSKRGGDAEKAEIGRFVEKMKDSEEGER
jgi:hypothetical protein